MPEPRTTLAGSLPWSTKRLHLREWRTSDESVTDAYDRDAARYNPWGVPKPGHYNQWLELMIDQARAGKRISWCVVHTNDVVGCVNIQLPATASLRSVAFVGFWTRPQFRRNGYIREVLSALVHNHPSGSNYGQDILHSLHKSQLLARIHPGNHASQHLVQRVGFKQLPAILPSSGDQIYRFRLSK